MSDLKVMAAEYRLAAAKLAISIDRHRRLGDLEPHEMNSLNMALRSIREEARLLSEYYEAPRPVSSITLTGLKARRSRD